MSPSAGLGLLQDLLAQSSPEGEEALTGRRLERVMAARFLAWIAARDPSLAPTALAIIKARVAVESDAHVRIQLLAHTGGVCVRPNMLFLKTDPPRAIAALVPDIDPDPGAPWTRSLKDISGKDADVVDLLERNVHWGDPARDTALLALARLGTDESTRALLARMKEDRDIRLLAAAAIDADRVDILRHFVEFLEGERDPAWIRAAARGIERGREAPEGTGRALWAAYRNRAEGDDEQRGYLARAAVGLRARVDDAAASEVVSAALLGSAAVREAALSAIAEHQAREFLPALRQRLSGVERAHEREMLRYVLRKLDPAFNEPSLYVELETLKDRLKASALTPAARAELEAAATQVQDRLESLREER